MSNPKIHNVRFYRPEPAAVHCMALHPFENKLALARSHYSVEIWNLNHTPFIERTIASSTENYSVEGLAWCNSRLFSVGLHGFLVEYDLFKLQVKSKWSVTGDQAFCIDVNKQNSQIAIGTEQGYLNIFTLYEDEVRFEKFLDKQEGRILCLKFEKSGEFIVTGGVDTIRIWSVHTNQALHRMVTARSAQNTPTIIWCLTITDDFTIISGDSRGVLTMWDGQIGAQIESYQSHQAGILAVCLTEDQNTLYCAGVDPNIISYNRIKVKEDAQKWVRSVQLKVHNHDVKNLVINGNKLYSGGIDGYLACSFYPPKTIHKYPPILQNSCVTVCNNSRCVLLCYPKCVEVWCLGEGGDEKDKSTGLYPVNTRPIKLLALHKVVETDDGVEGKEGIIYSTMSDDGGYILYSTRLGNRLLKLINDDGAPKLTPIELDGSSKIPCIKAVFLANGNLILAPNSGGLQVIQLDDDSAVLVQEIDVSAEVEDCITLLTASNSGKYLIVGDAKGNIVVWTIRNKQYVYYCKLPKFKSCPTALAVHPKTTDLVVAYANNSIIEYNLDSKGLTEFSRMLAKNSPKELSSSHSIFRTVTFDPRVTHVIILHDDDNVFVIEKQKNASTKTKLKIPRIEENVENDQFVVRSIKKYKHLVHLSWLADNEMVAVEINPLSLMEQLPPCLVQNTFGKK